MLMLLFYLITFVYKEGGREGGMWIVSHTCVRPNLSSLLIPNTEINITFQKKGSNFIFIRVDCYSCPYQDVPILKA